MLTRVIIAALFAIATGCDIPEVDLPCDGVECSGHGECIVLASGPRCDCDDGYLSTPNGLGCYEPRRPPADGGAGESDAGDGAL